MAAEEEINLDWNKIVRDNKKAGFRDGISEGREQNFQEYFDMGYKEGFQNGFLLGKHKGMLKAQSLINKTPYEEDNLLKDTRKGSCVMCKDTSLEDKRTTEIVSIQTQESAVLITRLQAKYNLNICKK